MKFRLVEQLEKYFTEIVDLEYDASELASREDDKSAEGTITIKLMPSDIMSDLWDFITEDSDPLLTEDQLEQLQDDDEAWEAYVVDNFDTLWKKYKEDFYSKYYEDAVDELHSSWSDYSDDHRSSQRELDNREYYKAIRI